MDSPNSESAYSTRGDADSLHRAQTVRQDLLDDPLRVLFQLIEPPRPGQQIPHDQ